MAKSRRRARKPAPQTRAEPKEHRRQAAIWLATLSTVVGIATGMFTLRDQVLPHESGSAQAVSTSAFQQQVGSVCDELNADDRRRARQVKTIHKQLRAAKTTTAQRNALLDGQRQTIARSGHALASFTALETPEDLRQTRRDVAAAWNRNLTRLQSYAERLDRIATRPELVAAVAYLTTLRTPLARDGVKLMSGLQRLGGANCDLRTPINTRTFPLPPLKTPQPEHEASDPGGSTGTSSGATSKPGATGSGSGAGAAPGGTNGGASSGTPGTTGGGALPPNGTGTPGGTGGSSSPGGGGGTGTGGSTGGSGGPAGGG